MSKTWTLLIALLLTSLVVMTGYQFYRSLTGQNKPRTYSVDMIKSDLGTEVLDFLDTKKQEIRKDTKDI